MRQQKMTDNRRANLWKKLISSEALDTRLLESGQAQANYELSSLMSQDHPLETSKGEKNLRVLVAGAGTGQLFSFADPREIFGNENLSLTVTDTCEGYLQEAANHLENYDDLDFETVVDSVEETKLIGSYDLVSLTLLLEHVNLRKSLDSLMSLEARQYQVIIQANQEKKDICAVNASSGSRSHIWKEYVARAQPQIVNPNALKSFFSEYDFLLK